MCVPTIEGMREGLKANLSKMFKARQTFNRSFSELQQLGVNERSLSLFLCETTAAVVKCYFETLCAELTRTYCQGTPAEVSLQYSLGNFDRYSSTGVGLDNKLYLALLHAEEAGMQEQLNLLEEVVNRVDFAAIEASLKHQVEQLADVGFSLIADNYLKAMKIYSKYGSIKATGRHVVLYLDSCSNLSARERQAELFDVRQLHQRVEEMSGVSFGFAVSDLYQTIENLTFRNPAIPSRTSFGKGSNLEIVCFKSQFEFRYTRKAFDAISAFINLYGKGDRYDNWLRLTAGLDLPLAS